MLFYKKEIPLFLISSTRPISVKMWGVIFLTVKARIFRFYLYFCPCNP